jgi:hypothetical protein
MFLSPRRVAPRLLLFVGLNLTRVSPAAEAPAPARDRSPQDVLVFSSMLPSAKFPRPTPDKPVYYLAMAGGFHAEGPQTARDDANKVGPDAVWPTLEKALLAQGYRHVTKKTPPPSLLVVFHWGTISPDSLDVPGAGSAMLMNEKHLGELVGATRVDRHLESEFGRMYHNATEPRYLVIVTAFDYAKATATPREKIVVWRTRLSVPQADTTLLDAIAPMIVTGGPFFGRDTAQPKEIHWDAAKVEIGEARVVDTPASGEKK